jgi:serine/threonine protein kinase
MFSDKDYSLYDGIPKCYQMQKNKHFEEWEIPPWNLIILSDQMLGEGQFGKVYKGKWNHTEVVVKIVNDKIPENKKKLFFSELNVMTQCHHPNIVQILGYVEDPFLIVMEYLPNGDLLDYIKKNNICKSAKIEIVLDILKAICYLHNRKPNYIVHRDIKPQNILISPSGKAKIGDFGLSRLFINEMKRKLSGDLNSLMEKKDEELTIHVGSLRYMAPEMKNNKFYTHKVDIWSCGVIFYELFENERYYPEHGFIWRKCPSSIKDLIVRLMIRQEPNDRLNACELIPLFESEFSKKMCCFF